MTATTAPVRRSRRRRVNRVPALSADLQRFVDRRFREQLSLDVRAYLRALPEGQRLALERDVRIAYGSTRFDRLDQVELIENDETGWKPALACTWTAP